MHLGRRPLKNSRAEVVVLKDGLSVSRLALDLAWDLEKQGHDLGVADDGEHLLVSTDGPDRTPPPSDPAIPD